MENEPIIEESIWERQHALKLCFISFLMYSVPALAIILGAKSLLIGDGVSTLFLEIVSFCPIAGFVLMANVRQKYPKNIFGKLLLGLYIVSAVVGAIILFNFS